MECFSNPVCIFTAVSDALVYGAAFIDYLGHSIAGDSWDALLPLVEDYSRRIDRLANLFSPRPNNSCGPAAGLEELNA
jgi:hypothetical protein